MQSFPNQPHGRKAWAKQHLPSQSIIQPSRSFGLQIESSCLLGQRQDNSSHQHWAARHWRRAQNQLRSPRDYFTSCTSWHLEQSDFHNLQSRLWKFASQSNNNCRCRQTSNWAIVSWRAFARRHQEEFKDRSSILAQKAVILHNFHWLLWRWWS